MTEGLDRTRAMGSDIAAPASGATLMATTVACALCGLANSPLETYCADCGLLLGSSPGSLETPAQEPLGLLRDAGTGRTYAIYPGANTIGRATGTIVIMDPNLSRSHAQVDAAETGVTITDLGSANGTLVDGMPLSANAPAPLRHGTTIRLGATTLNFETPTEAAALERTAHQAGAAGAFLDPVDGGEPISLHRGTNSIGRKPGSAVLLTDAYVSGCHAEIEGDPAGWRLRDLGSTNGTTLDGIRLERDSWHELPVGAQIRFGQAAFVFRPVPPSDDTVWDSPTEVHPDDR